ncbi:DUF4229 domain-containing protein [Gordonia hydrophobica]|uniref:DUF4229 domain-containing protein n=1 Tax=Gordonia hydrophobica TaxID=40516 RepID=A0ABZ2TWV3_9ACTN|nr:DUF4229 domain-containing protein [Gordonia hydrophobica]MBM7365965.1 putative membrane protein [Gordonia hydrophobica]
MTVEEPNAQQPAESAPATMGSLILAVVLYSLARLALVVVLAAAIFFIGKAFGVTVFPLAAAAFGVLIALPLSLVLFKSLRLRVNDQIAQVDARRSAQREDLQSRLRGED